MTGESKIVGPHYCSLSICDYFSKHHCFVLTLAKIMETALKIRFSKSHKKYAEIIATIIQS